MAQKTDIQLKQQWELIRVETLTNANSANRVGTAGIDIIDSKVNKSDISNIDNTSDLNKPISTATQSALDNKVDKVVGKQLSTEDYTSAEKTKLTGIETGAEVNDTGNEIVTKLESLAGNDRLNVTAIDGAELDTNPAQFELNGSNQLTIQTDTVPVSTSTKFINSGSLFNLGLTNLIPGYNDTLEQTEDTIGVAFRRLVVKNGVFFGCSSTGDNNRLYVSMDGRVFTKAGTTGSIAAYALDVAPHGTIIIVDRTSGTTNIKRSTDGGATFANATIATAYEVTGVKYIGGGRWVGSCRTGTGNRAIYSIDDGLNWSSATTANDNPYEDIGFGGGYVFMVAGTGTNRVQISTDNGETYTGSAPAQNQFWGKCLFFKGSIVLVRVGTGIFGIGGYITHSSDGGTTWTESLPADDGTQQINGASVIGEWLYLYGNDGYIIRSKDLVTKEVVYAANALTTNDISGMAETVINGYSTIMAVCSTGINDRVFSNIII